MLEQFLRRPLASSAFLLLILAIAIVLAAFGFEHIGGYKPCHLCLLERKAWYIAIPAALATLLLLKFDFPIIAKLLLVAFILMFIVNAGLSGYHAGIEWKWWAGPTTCTGDLLTPLGGGTDGLLEALNKVKIVRCDVAQFRLFGLSFSGYNFLISLFAAGLALFGLVGARFQGKNAA